MNILWTLAIGIIIGMANVIPGVSGSTIAVVFGIYDKFIDAITLNVKKLWKNKKFVLPIVTGMALGVLILSKLITLLYEKFPMQTNFFFTGLIIGSVPMLVNLSANKKDGTKVEKSKTKSIVVCVIIGIAIMILFSMLESSFGDSQGMIKTMIVPGISGSLLMLILGVYPIVIKSISALFLPESFFSALVLLLPNGVGVLAGLLLGARLIKNLLEKAPNHTYAVILGLLCGSALNICPITKNIFQGVFFQSLLDFKSVSLVLSSAAALIVGSAMAYFSSKFSPSE